MKGISKVFDECIINQCFSNFISYESSWDSVKGRFRFSRSGGRPEILHFSLALSDGLYVTHGPEPQNTSSYLLHLSFIKLKMESILRLVIKIQ